MTCNGPILAVTWNALTSRPRVMRLGLGRTSRNYNRLCKVNIHEACIDIDVDGARQWISPWHRLYESSRGSHRTWVHHSSILRSAYISRGQYDGYGLHFEVVSRF